MTGDAALDDQVAERAAALWERVEAHARGPVEIVAVTKGHPARTARAARRAGFRCLGENYAQELRAKAAEVDDVEWHFVGRLQSNKVRTIASVVALWQSVDRASLVAEIARRAPGAAVLVQVDLAGIPGRGGCAREDVEDLVASCSSAGLDVRGLMGVGIPGPPEDSRSSFRWLRGRADGLGLSVVSMGMSADLEVALQEGSTMVRVGTDLLGPRPARA